MHRTNIYLTDEQEAALDSRARAQGMSRAGVVRAILDEHLGLTTVDPRLEQALLGIADRLETVTGDLFADDPDLRID
jgi:hypothetical protein